MAVEVALGDVEIGPRLIELGLRADAALLQFRHSIEVGLRLVALRLLRSDSRIQRLHLQGELLIGDDGNLRPGGDDIPFPDREGGDGASNPGPRDKLMNRFDRRDDSFPVGDIGRMHDESVGREGGAGAEQGKKQRDGKAHADRFQKRLDLYMSGN